MLKSVQEFLFKYFVNMVNYICFCEKVIPKIVMMFLAATDMDVVKGEYPQAERAQR